MAGGKSILKTGRYVRFAENQQLGRLHLSLLHSFGVDIEGFGGSLEPLPGLNGGGFDPYRERPFKSWLKVEGDQITVQGRLRMSDDLDEAKIFYVDVDGQPSVRIEVGFRDFHDFNLAYHCGTGVTLSGDGSSDGTRAVVTKVTDVKSIFGRSDPGSKAG